MKIYLAAATKVTTDPFYTAALDRWGAKVRELISFAEITTRSWARTLAASKYRSDLFIDSGAYSAWTRGIPIDLPRYAAFLAENAKIITVAANLVVIPGRPGYPASVKDTEKACEQGWENLYRLRELTKGTVQIAHAYHRGEHVRWLERLVKECQGYMAISPRADKASRSGRDEWVATLKALVPREIKVHGFAVTGYDVMRAFNWHSVDSTTWMFMAKCKIALVPYAAAGGRWLDVHVSERRSEPRHHYLALSKPERDVTDQLLAEAGFTVKEITENQKALELFNVYYFLQLEKQGVAVPALSQGSFGL